MYQIFKFLNVKLLNFILVVERFRMMTTIINLNSWIWFEVPEKMQKGVICMLRGKRWKVLERNDLLLYYHCNCWIISFCSWPINLENKIQGELNKIQKIIVWAADLKIIIPFFLGFFLKYKCCSLTDSFWSSSGLESSWSWRSNLSVTFSLQSYSNTNYSRHYLLTLSTLSTYYL